MTSTLPISPFKPIEIIQTELHNRITPREEEDRLHSEIRGEKLEFSICPDNEPQDVCLRVQNLVLTENYNVQVICRVRNYECPTDIDDWREDIRFLYTTNFLRDPKELGDPLLSDINITALNPHDIEIIFKVHRTNQSSIWTAIRRFASVISVYHNDHFQTTKRIHETHTDIDWNDDKVPMGVAIDLAEKNDDWNHFQAYSYVLDYGDWKSESENETRNQIPTDG